MPNHHVLNGSESETIFSMVKDSIESIEMEFYKRTLRKSSPNDMGNEEAIKKNREDRM